MPGMPTVNTAPTFSRFGPGPRMRGAISFCRRRNTARQYRLAVTFEMSVAMPTPSTSLPLGSRTNMNSGSSPMFSTPPSATPTPASRESPRLRRRFDRTLEKIVGTPPSTSTVSTYTRAWG